MKNSSILVTPIFILLLYYAIVSTSPFTYSFSQEESTDIEERCTYSESVIYDDKGIPYYNYGVVEGIFVGIQRSPVTIANEALRFYEDEHHKGSGPENETAKRFFLNNADWLVDNVTLKKYNETLSYATYEYNFAWPYYNLHPPWRDGMTQGRALEVLVGASKITDDQKYLDTAELILNSYLVEVRDGGVTYKSPTRGWWYEHYADNDTNGSQEPRVLNAMLFAVLGIHEYYKYTNDPIAKFLFDQGVLALKNDLPKYDNNGDSLYDAMGTKAGSYYLPVHIELLNELYELTEEPIFKKYHDVWGAYFVLNQYSGRKLEDVYHDICINKKGLFKIDLRLDNATKELDLLNNTETNWHTVNDADITAGDALNIFVETDKEIETYNRAFLRTELNLRDQQDYSDQKKSPVLLLEYSAGSTRGNATFVGEMMDITNNNKSSSGFSFALTNDGSDTTDVFVVPVSLINKPVEFRLYAITDEPGSHFLKVGKADIYSGASLLLSPLT